MKLRFFSLIVVLFSAVALVLLSLFVTNNSGEVRTPILVTMIILAVFCICWFFAYWFGAIRHFIQMFQDSRREASCLKTFRYSSSSDEIKDWNDEKYAYINRSIAIHEAGHIVVAKTINIPINYVSVSFTGGSNCVSTICPPVCFAEDLYKQILLFYGGMAAEQVLCGCISSSNISAPSMVQNEENSGSDFDRAKDFLLSYVRTTSFPDILSAEQESNLVNEFSRKFFDKAVKIVELQKEDVEAIAAELLEESIDIGE